MEHLDKPELYFIEKYSKWSNLRKEIIDKIGCMELPATAFLWKNQSSTFISYIRLEPSEGRQDWFGEVCHTQGVKYKEHLCHTVPFECIARLTVPLELSSTTHKGRWL